MKANFFARIPSEINVNDLELSKARWSNFAMNRRGKLDLKLLKLRNGSEGI